MFPTNKSEEDRKHERHRKYEEGEGFGKKQSRGFLFISRNY